MKRNERMFILRLIHQLALAIIEMINTRKSTAHKPKVRLHQPKESIRCENTRIQRKKEHDNEK